MAFSTRRGRPRRIQQDTRDLGTAELRRNHALGTTTEPIDLCVQKKLITPAQHWCGLHLRWLYTIRYGAPSLTTHYILEATSSGPAQDCDAWRIQREQEYRQAVDLLHRYRRYEPVMRVSVYNELPAFLNPALMQRAWSQPALASRLHTVHTRLQEGLELLVGHWKRTTDDTAAATTSQRETI